MTPGKLLAPAPIHETHDLEPFDCGVPVLADWLKKRARKNEGLGASRTYVLCDGDTVVGYYSLASGAVARDAVPGQLRRNMPDPVPVIVLGRLAIDRHYQHRGLGQDILRDAVLRVVQAAEIVGLRAILVHAISEDAKRFYRARGFLESPIEPMTLCLPLDVARRAVMEPQ
jgi:GNAT superfamily N-acetyltransferase